MCIYIKVNSKSGKNQKNCGFILNVIANKNVICNKILLIWSQIAFTSCLECRKGYTDSQHIVVMLLFVR